MDLDKILKEAEKYGDVIVFLNKNIHKSVDIEKNSLSNFNQISNNTLEIRIMKGRKYGYSETNNVKDYKKCIRCAAKILKISKPLKIRIPISGKKKFPEIKNTFDNSVANLEIKDLSKFSELLLKTAKKENKKINVSRGGVSVDISENTFLNSSGVYLEEKYTSFSSGLECNIGTSSAFDMRNTVCLHDVNEVAENAAELAIRGQNPKQAEIKKMDLILDYFALSEIFEQVFIPSFFADRIMRKKSYLFDKLGKKVFSKNLNIVENPLFGLYARKSDMEGTPSRKTTLVKNGKVKHFMYDLYSAALENKRSTSHHVSLSKIPSIGPSNFTVSSGKKSLYDMINETKEGIYAYNLMGAHTANEITGDASLTLQNAFYIKNGAIRYPVKNAMISFNIFEAFKNVEIGSEIRQENNLMSPPIKFFNIQVIS